MSTAVLLEAVALATTSDDDFLSEVRALGIRIPRPPEVRDYLRQFPDIIPAARLACEAAMAEFAGKAELSLELYIDPEIHDPHLKLYVQYESYDAALWEGVERVQEAYSEALADATGWIHVSLDIRASNRR